jgi:parallel beta-helix repeat protein
MKTLIPSILLCALTWVALFSAASSLQASTVTLIDSNALGQSWETGSDWSDGQPAGPGKEYLIDGDFSMRTPDDGDDDVFPGDSLTVNTSRFDRGIGVKGSTDKTITFADLRWGGGRFNLGNDGTFTLAGGLDVFDGERAGILINATGNRSLTIDAEISGSGQIEVKLDDSGGSLKLTNPANSWEGELLITSGTVDFDYTHNQLQSLLTANGGNFILDEGTHVFGLGSTLGGDALAAGTYTASQLNSLGFGGTSFSGTGSIRIGKQEPPRLEAFTYSPIDGSAEVRIKGDPAARYKLVEADDLDFANPSQDPLPLASASVGTLVDNDVLLDANGDGTVQFNLGTEKQANFFWAERVTENLVIEASADSYVADGANADNNFGSTDNLRTLNTDSDQHELLLRFDLPAGTEAPDSAFIIIETTGGETDPVQNAAYLTDGSAWSELGVTWNNRPLAGAELDAWVTSNGRSIKIDVTDAVTSALPTGGSFEVLVQSPHNVGNDGLSVYASREHDSLPGPRLELRFNEPSITVQPGQSVQDALDAMNALGGGRVLLAAGDHLVSQSLEVYSHITLAGEGAGVSQIKLDPSVNVPILIGTSEGTVNRNITIRDLTLDGQQAEGERSYPGSTHNNRGSVRANSFGILFTDTESGNSFENIRIEDVEVTRCAMGIHIKGVNDLRIQNSDIRDNGCIIGFDHNIYFRRANNTLLKNLDISDCTAGNGFNLSTNCFNVILDNCDASDNTFRGIRFEAGDGGSRMMIINSTASRNGLTQNQPGIRVSGVPDFTIIGTTADDNGSHGIYCRFSNNGLIRDNSATGNGGDNFRIENSSNIDAFNNVGW